MADVEHLRARAESHRRIARASEDLWECVTRFGLAAHYEELALHLERQAAARRPEEPAAEAREPAL